ncbi:hypothetical protein M3I54_22645 [Paraburkholderia sp. CNPSo 3274]|uniref:crAss001_48 related protein n=1 Tax=Paraburkholderia sp. CNPSo 3274 TaxID=2940932 RepID=UPI0020B87F8B|nr:hypothetical protein [Paraburkholderia sp. CNPSo 3274]MCP3709746.1 hypothetical protein [Paraburkholderia sp. CNPSo 3274]
MIEPSIGRVVWFRPGKNLRNVQTDLKQPLAAIVCYVHGPRSVNLSVFDALGKHHAFVNVPLLQDDDKAPDGEMPYAEWMPFQKGQAAKTEAAEAKAMDTNLAAYTSPAPQRAPHQQRVIVEKTHLDERLSALTAFFGTEIFNGLAELERGRLRAQAVAMESYSTILGDRIAAFE